MHWGDLLWMVPAWLGFGAMVGTVFTRMEYRRNIREGKTYNLADDGSFNMVFGVPLWPIFLVVGLSWLASPVIKAIVHGWMFIATPSVARKQLRYKEEEVAI
jgi:hypothetical protein